MAQVTIELEGLDELVAQFQGLPEKYRQRSQGTIEAGLTNIEADWKRFAPVNTGRYRDEIHRSRGQMEPDEIGGAVVSDLDPPYDVFQELGFTARDGTHVPAQPSAQPAAALNFPRIRDDLIRDLEAALAGQ